MEKNENTYYECPDVAYKEMEMISLVCATGESNEDEDI